MQLQPPASFLQAIGVSCLKNPGFQSQHCFFVVYESRLNRPTPAISEQTDSNKQDFYQDQYGERDKKQYQERMERIKLEREKEEVSRKKLEDEVELMKRIAQDSNNKKE